jgi:hypothetical protein
MMWKRAWLAVAMTGPVAAAGVLGATSCGEQFEVGRGTGGAGAAGPTGGNGTGGVTSTPVGGAGGAACPDYPTPCFICAKTQCSALYCGCVTSPCLNLAICVSSCQPANDPACLQPCYTANPDYVSSSALLSNCMGTACAADCPTYQPLPACQLCMFQSCASVMNACLADPSCAALLRCAEVCLEPTCLDGCNAANPQGVNLATAVRACLNVSCQPDCPWGATPDAGVRGSGAGVAADAVG